ncbi:MAG TPA: asparaginase [Clostridia bacterium]|nr:asparaginase [Clostridia bacterium]
MIARTTRGKYTDLSYSGHIVVANAQGDILYSHGDPLRFSFARSSTKPLQALLALETGALDHYKITDKELALMCGSHGGSTEHTKVVGEILDKGGLSQKDLQCGAHPPLMKTARKELEKTGQEPNVLHNNCSAKHSAMLLSASYLGQDLKTYTQISHPHQQSIIKLLGEFTSMDPGDFGLAIDGCGVPVHGAPLYKWAQAFARLDETSSFSKSRQEHILRLSQAMAKYPEMVAGPARLCTDLLIHFKDRVIAKGGANAFYALSLKNQGLGIAIKVESGESRLLAGIILQTLLQLGIISPEEMSPFESYTKQELINHQGVLVGETLVDFKLQKHPHPSPIKKERIL